MKVLLFKFVLLAAAISFSWGVKDNSCSEEDEEFCRGTCTSSNSPPDCRVSAKDGSFVCQCIADYDLCTEQQEESCEEKCADSRVNASCIRIIDGSFLDECEFEKRPQDCKAFGGGTIECKCDAYDPEVKRHAKKSKKSRRHRGHRLRHESQE